MYYLYITSQGKLLKAKPTKPFNTDKNNRQDCMLQSHHFRQCMESGVCRDLKPGI